MLTPEQIAVRDNVEAKINEVLEKAPTLVKDAEAVVNDITNAGNALGGIVAALPDIMKLVKDANEAIAPAPAPAS